MNYAKAYLAAGLILVSAVAQAIAPESGMYWQPQLSGRAFYIEHQEGRVGVAIYAFHRETGAPEIYVSGDLLRDEAPPIVIFPFDPPAGVLPFHRYGGDLYRVSHGQPLASPHFPGRPAQEVKVGRIELYFQDAGGVGFILRGLDDSSLDAGMLERFAFGHARNADHEGKLIGFDLRGEWVFVDQADPMAAPMRFHFTQRLPEDAPFQIEADASFALSYVDPQRDARLVCEQQSPPIEHFHGGCELYVGEELILSANLKDVGLDRIQAYRGSLAAPPEYIYRRPETVIGLRVVMPPASETPQSATNE